MGSVRKLIPGIGEGYIADPIRHSALWRKLAAKYHDPQDIDDAVQDAYLAAIKAQEKYKKEKGTTYTAYAGKAVCHALIGTLQKKIKNRFSQLPPDYQAKTHPSDKVLACVYRCVESLPNAPRIVIEELFYRGHSMQYVASILHIPMKSVQAILDEALAMIRDAVLRECDGLV